MNISEPFIRRPVMTTLVMSGILLFGVVAYRGLPVSDLPNVDFPTLQVLAQLPGASPETMAASVATPLERQFSTIAGLDNMTSTSTLGAASILWKSTLWSVLCEEIYYALYPLLLPVVAVWLLAGIAWYTFRHSEK